MTKTIGKSIRSLRIAMGLNQAHLAEFLNVDQSLVSKIENGERCLSSDMLEKLSYLFGVPTSSLENGLVDKPRLSVAFRANDMTAQNLQTICDINRIALNVEFMTRLLKETNHD